MMFDRPRFITAEYADDRPETSYAPRLCCCRYCRHVALRGEHHETEKKQVAREQSSEERRGGRAKRTVVEWRRRAAR